MTENGMLGWHHWLNVHWVGDGQWGLAWCRPLGFKVLDMTECLNWTDVCINIQHLFSFWEKTMAPRSSTLAWNIPWTEEPGRLQSMRSLRVGYDFTFTFHFHALEKDTATHSSILAWRISGTGEPGGLPSMGLHRVGHGWSDLVAAAVLFLTYFTLYSRL